MWRSGERLGFIIGTKNTLESHIVTDILHGSPVYNPLEELWSVKGEGGMNEVQYQPLMKRLAM